MTEKLYKNIILGTDILALVLSYVVALSMRDINIFVSTSYLNTLIAFILMFIVISLYVEQRSKDIFKRGYLEEYGVVFKELMLLIFMWAAYLFMTKQGGLYSRMVFITFVVLSITTVYVERCYQKLAAFIFLRYSKVTRNCIIVTCEDFAESVVERISNQWDVNITGLIIVDKDMIGSKIGGVEVSGTSGDLIKIAMNNVVDEVFINVHSGLLNNKKDAILELEKMGVTVHININVLGIKARNKVIEDYSGYNVVTYATTMYNPFSIFIKRVIDIIGSFVGLIITGIAFIFVAPAIKIESPGPIFFGQKRIGKNGREFKIYKFRSMYIDAEERKKELMAQNEMQGFMFKMKDDPRITKVGKFIRKTSIDELPQFWNIFKGDMSLVGTRPPTPDEVSQYETWHRRRLSIKPGLTGMWQVSGRNAISDFDDVVKYDLEYIDNWSLGMDIKLILKTVLVVFKHTGT